MSMSEALAEAYASSSIEDRVVDTLEFLHDAFVDGNGNPTSVRVVQDYEDFVGTLENTAPLNPGGTVTFKAAAFEFKQSGFSDGKIPTLQLTVSNIGRQLTTYLEQAISQTKPITLIYRTFLASDPSEPQIDPVVTMTLTAANVKTNSVTGTASLSDVHNWPFPNVRYTPETYPGLVRN